MFRIAHKVGRLIELEFHGVVDLDEAAAVAVRVNAVFAAHDHDFVALVDARRARASPVATTSLVRMMRDHNPRLARSAFLLPDTHRAPGGAGDFGAVVDAAVATLQIERMVKASDHAGRRTFRCPDALCVWLSEVLTVAERRRLQDVVDGVAAVRRSSAPG